MTEAISKTVSQCVECSAEIIGNKGKKYCSPKCRGRYSRRNKPKTIKPDRRKKPVYLECEWCGKEFKRKKSVQTFCSRKCSTSKTAFDLRVASQQKYRIKDLKCRTCDIMFSGYDSNYKHYCSDFCKLNYRCLSQCVWCNVIFDAGDSCARYCSDDCRIMMRRKKDTDRRIPTPKVWTQGNCLYCNKTFWMSRTKKYCSPKCSGKSAKHRRRALKKKAFVEDVNVGELFKRSKGKCCICGYKVKRNVDWNHPLAQTIDHIIPLAHGGEHSYLNTQLAHRHCNTWKGTMFFFPRL